MLFVNPIQSLPSSNAVLISPTVQPDSDSAVELGPNRAYVFAAGVTYDWGEDVAFEVHDNTAIFFETGAYVLSACFVSFQPGIDRKSSISAGRIHSQRIGF